jgi:hypothetical protein
MSGYEVTSCLEQAAIGAGTADRERPPRDIPQLSYAEEQILGDWFPAGKC